MKIILKAFVIGTSLLLLSWVLLTRTGPGSTDPPGLSDGAQGTTPGLEDSASGQKSPAPGHEDPNPGPEDPASGQENLGSADREVASYYVVAEYDEARDPAVDLEAAVALARGEGKRILLEVGGQWCGWCKRLDLFIHDHPDISDRLEKDFLVVKVNFSMENRNEDFLSEYPTIPGYPHIFVLEEDGRFLHSQGTAELEEGSSYNENALKDFLDAWKPGGSGA